MEFSELVRLAYPDAFLAIFFHDKARDDQYRVFLPSTGKYLGEQWAQSKEIAWRNAWDLPGTQRRIVKKL